MDLTAAQRDRAVGAVIGMATGDALGAGYEFQPPNPPDRIAMIGGGIGTFEPGEWTDDTTMAIPILEALARGDDLLDPAVQDWVAEQWVDWAGSPKDIGVTIGSVLGCAGDPVRAVDLSAAARAMYVAGHRAAGNGSLMRTTPIVLGFLDDPQALTAAARAYSDITHGDPVAAEACVLWNHAQRHAVVHAEFDMTVGLSHLPSERQEVWRDHIRVAESVCHAISGPTTAGWWPPCRQPGPRSVAPMTPDLSISRWPCAAPSPAETMLTRWPLSPGDCSGHGGECRRFR